MRFGWKVYFRPTPKRLRVLGDSLAAAGAFGSSIISLNGNPKLGTAILIAAVLGKFLSNFFTDENTSPPS